MQLTMTEFLWDSSTHDPCILQLCMCPPYFLGSDPSWPSPYFTHWISGYGSHCRQIDTRWTCQHSYSL